MPNKFGFQTQVGSPPDFHRIPWRKVAAWMYYDGALNEGMIATALAANPHILLIGRAPTWDWYVNATDETTIGESWAFIEWYAAECVRLLAPFAAKGLLHAVTSPNEPVVQTIAAAQLLNKLQIWFSDYIHANLKFPNGEPMHVIGYGHSVGNPRYDLVQYLRGGAEKSDYIGMHLYGKTDYNHLIQSEPEHYTLRCDNYLQLLGVPRKILATETGIDTRKGGYKSPTARDAGITVNTLIDGLKWQQDRANERDYIGAYVLFGAGMGGNDIQWGSFDPLSVGESDDPTTDRGAFLSFLNGLPDVTERITPGAIVIPPPLPEPEPEPPTGQPMNPADLVFTIPALLKKAYEQKLGAALSGELYFTSNGKNYVRQVFAGGVVVTQAGQWELSQIEVRDALTGAPIMAPPVTDPNPDEQPPNTFVLPKALADIGAVGEAGIPIAGQSFYKLTGASVRRGISAFMVVTLFSHGAPKIGAKVVNLFPDGNGEVVETDGSGNARFQFGASSAFTNPGAGPFTVFVADDGAFKDSDSVPKKITWQYRLSDIVKSLGDFRGEHTEIYLQLVEVDSAADFA